MGRGLDGSFCYPSVSLLLCGSEGPRRARSRHSPVAIARGRHLFPFRTEPLSPSAPMVLDLKGSGRVGRRRFFHMGRSARGGPLPSARGVTVAG